MSKFVSNYNRLLVSVSFLTFFTFILGQDLDSLKKEWHRSGMDLERKLEISSKISDLYFNVQLDSLEKYTNIQIQLAERLDNKKAVCEAFANLGSIFFRKGNLDKAVFYYKKSVGLAEDNGFTRIKMSSSANIASIYLMQGKNVSALRSYFIAKNSLFKLKNLDVMNIRSALRYEGQLNNNIGIAYFKMNDYKNASRFYSEALTISEQVKDSVTIGKVYTNLGEIELYESNFNVAEDFLFKGKRIKQRIGDSIGLKENYNLIGSLYLSLGSLKKAYDNFKITSDYLEEYEDKQLEKKLMINYSKYYLRLNDVDRSLKYLEKANKLNIEEYTLASELEINKLLSEAYFLKKNFEKSNLYREIYEGIRDSIFDTKQGLEIARMELYYNIENKNLKDSLDNLRDSSKRKADIHIKEVQNFYLIIWLIFLAIAFGAIVYVLNIVRKRNKELQKSIKEKEALMKEVHHRVKNNFQIISSLLNIQANKLKDKAYSVPMVNMQNRIIAMSLVHERLYISDFQEAVFINEYFQDLANSIKNSLLSNSSDISVFNENEDFLLSLEKAIPLGLVVNELITNSIKYGVDEGESIKIDLNIKKEGNLVHIELKDYGKGFPDDFNPESFTESIGLELVHVLIEQLDGEISFSNDNGAKINIQLEI